MISAIHTKQNTRNFFLGLVSCAFSFYSHAQMSVTPNNSAVSLAQAVAGVGVNVSNATINCGSAAAGTFMYSGSNLGLSGGIVLTTGVASQVGNSGSFLCNVNNGNNFSDPDLTAIVPTATFDGCILEFDFVPICDSLKMQFVFGSEEYPQGVGGYNDAFAIFLTGPKPSGGSYTAQNIATLPNGTPVSINNVNAGANSTYFHSSSSDIAYNGYTIPITSITPVARCSTYHVKFAIADAGNALYDSGVMISNNTLSCETPPVITVNTTATSGCNSTGSATVSVTNYTGTVNYHWLPGNATTATINNLSSGTYTCNITTHHACGTSTQSITAVVGTTASNIVLTSTQQNLTCYGASNASATVTPIGGTAPYNCIWNTTPAQSGLTATNLSVGNYTANVTDNGGCQALIQIHITSPPAMQVSVGTTSTTCTGSVGTASVNVTNNGTAPYTYTWSTTPAQHTQTATNLPHGNYNVIVTDAHSCTVSATASVSIQPISWSLSPTETNVACYGGSNGAVSAVITNTANNTFTYAWNTAPVQTTQTATNLSIGSYSCTVTDNNGCVLTTNASVTQPSLLTSTVNSLPTLCSGTVGSATATVSGGTQPYTYSWSTSPVQTTNTIHNLAQGQFTVNIKDAHNCTTTSVATITISNPTLQITTSVVNSVCGGPSGSINVSSVMPAHAPYSYTWTPMGQHTQSITNLFPGTYTVSINDANGCAGNTTATVGTNTFFPIQITTTPDYCGKNIGSATATPHANPPYQYHWSPGNQTSQAISNLPTGHYTVVVTDGYNSSCKDSVGVIISNAPNLSIQTSTTPTYCNKNFGSATATPLGYPPYQYHWSTAQTASTINNLTVGNYSVAVSDLYNCTATASVTVVNKNDSLISTFTTQPGGELYSLTPITLSVATNSGWTLNDGYLSAGISLAQTSNYTFEQSGDYTASYYFTSSHGCIDSVTYDIHVIDYSTLYIPNSFTPNNDGRNDVFKAEGTFITAFEMYIYDRWDNLIIKLDNIEKSWNGNQKGVEAPPDAYIYKGVATNIAGKQIDFHGQIILIR